MDYEILVVEALLEALLRGLDAELAGISIQSAGRDSVLELVRTSNGINADEARASLAQNFTGSGEVQVTGVTIPLFVTSLEDSEISGHMVIGSKRQGFPTETERLIISNAVLQARLALEKGRTTAHRPNDGTARRTDLTEVIDTIPGLA